MGPIQGFKIGPSEQLLSNFQIFQNLGPRPLGPIGPMVQGPWGPYSFIKYIYSSILIHIFIYILPIALPIVLHIVLPIVLAWVFDNDLSQVVVFARVIF